MHTATGDKYSLWITPTGSKGRRLQNIVDTLADRYDAPHFIPHITIVANIFIETPAQYSELYKKASHFASSIAPFELSLDRFGYTDEEFRSLFLLVQPSTALEDVYAAAGIHFSQVENEHFRTMPHLSILYGEFDNSIKRKIINDPKTQTIAHMTFLVDAFDLYLTNSPIESWQQKDRFKLRS